VVLGSRTRALAAAVTALAAVALAAAVAGRGCMGDDNSPEGAVRALLAAVRAGDTAAILTRLGPDTRGRLDAAAQRATELVGSGRRYQPVDLVSIGEPGPGATSLVVSRQGGDRAEVDILDEQGNRTTVEVVRVSGEWLVELPASVDP
jgi:hypothetical protein